MPLHCLTYDDASPVPLSVLQIRHVILEFMRRTPKKYKKQTEINWVGLAAYIFFYCAFGFYLWIRITKTLDLGLYIGALECLAALLRRWADCVPVQGCNVHRVSGCLSARSGAACSCA